MCALPASALDDQASEHQGGLESHGAASPTSALGNAPCSGMDRDVLPAPCSSLPRPHTLPHTRHLPHIPPMNRTAATGLGKTEQRCRRDCSGDILAICRTIGSFLWAWPRWIIISRPHMLIGAGAQPALYPLAGHHHIPAQDWKSKATKPKQKLCVKEGKKTLLPAGNQRKPCGTSTVNKN